MATNGTDFDENLSHGKAIVQAGEGERNKFKQK